jgi:DNA-binding CsgD family transcriptional regulator
LGREILERILDNLPIPTSVVQERTEGAVFLKLARGIYPVHSVVYIAFNIPIIRSRQTYLHCTYTDEWAKHCASDAPVPLTDSSINGILDAGINWGDQLRTPAFNGEQPNRTMLGIRVPCSRGEVATMVVIADSVVQSSSDFQKSMGPEFHILAAHFYKQLMKLFAVNPSDEAAVTARELECLKWIAQGKTAWEASVILGISERTVRFHLNSAREKLCCINTTQAVAKAVSDQLIVV